MALALIDHGAPLDSEVSNPKFPAVYKVPVVAGFSLLESATRGGQVRLFVGIGIDEPEPPRPNAAYVPQGKAALANLGPSYLCGNRRADRVATAQRLLACSLWTSDPDMLNLLLIHGAER